MHFLHKAHHSFPALRNPRQPLSTTFGEHFKQQNCQQKAQNWGNVALKRPWEGYLFTVEDLKQKGRASPCLTSSGNACIRQLQFSTLLRMSMSDCGIHEHWVCLYKYIWVGESANTKPANNEDGRYFSVHIQCSVCLSRQCSGSIKPKGTPI